MSPSPVMKFPVMLGNIPLNTCWDNSVKSTFAIFSGISLRMSCITLQCLKIQKGLLTINDLWSMHPIVCQCDIIMSCNLMFWFQSYDFIISTNWGAVIPVITNCIILPFKSAFTQVEELHGFILEVPDGLRQFVHWAGKPFLFRGYTTEESNRIDMQMR